MLGQGNVSTGVCDSVHGGDVCLSAGWDNTPPGADTPPRPGTPPQEQTPPPDQVHHPPGSRPPRTRYTPQSRHPPRSRHLPPRTRYTPVGADTAPGSRHLPREADYGIRSMSGRHASYWNAFLFNMAFIKFCEISYV